MAVASPAGLARAQQHAWRGLSGFNRHLARGVVAVVALFATAMVASIVWQITTRALLGRSPPWTEEVALLLFTWVVLLTIALCVREGLHVRIDTLPKLLPASCLHVGEGVISLLITGIGGYLAWSGSVYLWEMRGATSQAIRYPFELLYAAMPLAGLLVFLFSLENALRGATAKDDPA